LSCSTNYVCSTGTQIFGSTIQKFLAPAPTIQPCCFVFSSDKKFRFAGSVRQPQEKIAGLHRPSNEFADMDVAMVIDGTSSGTEWLRFGSFQLLRQFYRLQMLP